MTPIMIDPPTLQNIEAEIAAQFRKHIESTGLHVALINVNMGKALPDKPVIDEMNNTAAQQQRRKTGKRVAVIGTLSPPSLSHVPKDRSSFRYTKDYPSC
jgi:hypothetical protein